MVIGEEDIEINAGPEKGELNIDEIEKIFVGDRFPVVFIYTSGHRIPSVINTLTDSWKHMVHTLIERVGSDVEVVDPTGVTQTPKTDGDAHGRDSGEVDPISPNESFLIAFGVVIALPALIAILIPGFSIPVRGAAGVGGVGLGWILFGVASHVKRKINANTGEQENWSWSQIARIAGWSGVGFLSMLGGCALLP